MQIYCMIQGVLSKNIAAQKKVDVIFLSVGNANNADDANKS